MKKNVFLLAMLAIVLVFGMAVIACDNGSGNSDNNDGTDNPQTLQRTFTIQLLDYDVTVQDTRTGTDDQSLEDMGIIEKLGSAVRSINNNKNLMPDSVREKYMLVLNKGMIIEVEKPAVPYTTDYRTKADGKTMMFDIDYCTAATVGPFITAIDYAIQGPLARGEAVN